MKASDIGGKYLSLEMLKHSVDGMTINMLINVSIMWRVFMASLSCMWLNRKLASAQ